MMITIDTSVIIGVITHEPGREEAIAVTAGHELVAPASLHWEIGNALSAMVKRRRMTLADARLCVSAYLEIPLKLVDVDLESALTHVHKLRMYAYDAYMLACALQCGGPLLTFDDALRAGAESLGINVLEVQ